jgi:hypothetical protein
VEVTRDDPAELMERIANTKRSLPPHEYVTELPCHSTKANCRPVRETAVGNMAGTAWP